MSKTISPEGIVHNLRVIRDYGEFPKGLNNLYSQYKNLGLVKMSDLKKVSSSGYSIKGKGYLTPNSKVKLTRKGYKILRGFSGV